LPLKANEGLSFNGSFVLNVDGFTLTPRERNALIDKDPKNGERIFPYIGGKEVNSSPTQDFYRYVINFDQMSLEDAEQWPDLLERVRRLVKPERERTNARCKRWWQYSDPRPGLYRSLAPFHRCLVTGRVSKHVMFSFQPTGRVFSEALYVFPLESWTAFSVLQSRVHEYWARIMGSSLQGTSRYTAETCFETFPFPQKDPKEVVLSLEGIGQRLYAARAEWMTENQKGLTKLYNAIKAGELPELQQLHEEMDREVLRSYGWSDLDVPNYAGHDQDFEDELLDRLFVLNEERSTAPSEGGILDLFGD